MPELVNERSLSGLDFFPIKLYCTAELSRSIFRARADTAFDDVVP